MTATKRPWSSLRLCCLALLALVAGLSLILRPWRWGIKPPLEPPWRMEPPLELPLEVPLDNREPEFAACDYPEACGPPGMRSYYKLDLLKRAARVAISMVESGRTPLIMQIGAWTLGNTQIFSDMDLWLRVLGLLPSAVRDSIRMVFVEPNEFGFPEMRENIKLLKLRPDQTQVVHAMITDECPSENVTMYRFSGQVALDFGVPCPVYCSWMGTEARIPLLSLRGYAKHTALDSPEARKWQAFAAAENRSAYVQDVQIPCLSVPRLMDAAGAAVADMVILVIDAEAKDFPIVRRFLDVPGFAPSFLQYECIFWGAREALSLLPRQRWLGFSVGNTYGHARNNSDADNCIAIRRRHAREI